MLLYALKPQIQSTFKHIWQLISFDLRQSYIFFTLLWIVEPYISKSACTCRYVRARLKYFCIYNLAWRRLRKWAISTSFSRPSRFVGHVRNWWKMSKNINSVTSLSKHRWNNLTFKEENSTRKQVLFCNKKWLVYFSNLFFLTRDVWFANYRWQTKCRMTFLRLKTTFYWCNNRLFVTIFSIRIPIVSFWINCLQRKKRQFSDLFCVLRNTAMTIKITWQLWI